MTPEREQLIRNHWQRYRNQWEPNSMGPAFNVANYPSLADVVKFPLAEQPAPTDSIDVLRYRMEPDGMVMCEGVQCGRWK